MSDLDRFVEAQVTTYPVALTEIEAGRKQSHWMWYIFPQLAGLGRSERARYYGLSGLAEARDYWAHPVLGARLDEISRALLAHAGTPPEAILGSVDALKLRSCATLFEVAAEGAGPFAELLEAFYGGERCPLTLEELERG
ncbi:DUF1810 domain-containing protein [Psychromarinibacter sp. C21-152]|uniref:DUF1810 domain-containing protein n=1 Tax=Psychromarinibacter sediminicola TaxID=3033385 RepID=A0AAE3NUN5_9RHOB|nr:DUF1810 domain-containing protein [Psychromarinibacter sediminicola]MDF0602599.1 DUF1810 domain-containing protein [Psychromarinibacter sediminicola]